MNKYIEEILMYESANKNKPFDLALMDEDVRDYVFDMLRKEYERDDTNDKFLEFNS